MQGPEERICHPTGTQVETIQRKGLFGRKTVRETNERYPLFTLYPDGHSEVDCISLCRERCEDTGNQCRLLFRARQEEALTPPNIVNPGQRIKFRRLPAPYNENTGSSEVDNYNIQVKFLRGEQEIQPDSQHEINTGSTYKVIGSSFCKIIISDDDSEDLIRFELEFPDQESQREFIEIIE